MGITAQEAIARLDTIETKEELAALIDELDTVGNGKKKTIFFSGSDEIKETVKSLQNEYRTIHSTEAYKFLTSDEFAEAVEDIIEIPSERNNFVNVDIGKGGAWDTVSRNFAKATEGEVILLAGKRDCRNNTVKPINNITFKKEEAA